MANFTPSNLVKAQARFNDLYMSGEWRAPDTAALSAAYMGEKAMPLLSELRKREDRLVSGYLPVRRAKSAAAGRTHNHTGARGTSQEVPIVWETSADTFSLSLKQNDNNLYSFEENYASQLQSAIWNVLSDADAKFLTNLTADRTQINAGGINGVFDGVDFVMEVANTEKDQFFANLQANMRQNLYKGNLTVIHDSLLGILAGYQANQGQGNATNLGYQFLNMNMVQSTSAILGGLTDTYSGAALAFESDLTGITPWIPVQNRKSIDPVKAMSYNGDFGSISVPILDANGNVAKTVDLAIHMYAERADTSGLNGSAQDEVIQVEVSLDTAYVSAPLSDLRGANDSVVYGFGLLG